MHHESRFWIIGMSFLKNMYYEFLFEKYIQNECKVMGWPTRVDERWMRGLIVYPDSTFTINTGLELP